MDRGAELVTEIMIDFSTHQGVVLFPHIVGFWYTVFCVCLGSAKPAQPEKQKGTATVHSGYSQFCWYQFAQDILMVIFKPFRFCGC